MEVRQARHFLAVVDHRTTGRAAVELHMTQPALSQSVVALERELRVRLFQRSARGMTLTPEGEALVQPARHLVESSMRAVAAVERAAPGHPRPRGAHAATRGGRAPAVGRRPAADVDAADPAGSLRPDWRALSIAVETEFMDTIPALVAAGTGAALLSALTAHQLTGLGIVVRRPEPAIDRSYFLLYVANRLSYAAQAFLRIATARSGLANRP